MGRFVSVWVSNLISISRAVEVSSSAPRTTRCERIARPCYEGRGQAQLDVVILVGPVSRLATRATRLLN
jgi:hypothetical protein